MFGWGGGAGVVWKLLRPTLVSGSGRIDVPCPSRLVDPREGPGGGMTAGLVLRERRLAPWLERRREAENRACVVDLFSLFLFGLMREANQRLSFILVGRRLGRSLGIWRERKRRDLSAVEGGRRKGCRGRR